MSNKILEFLWVHFHWYKVQSIIIFISLDMDDFKFVQN